jgi:hypothetical protein
MAEAPVDPAKAVGRRDRDAAGIAAIPFPDDNLAHVGRQHLCNRPYGDLSTF